MAPSDQPTLAKWEETLERTDRIPVIDGGRKSTWRIRKLARKIMSKLKLAPELDPKSTTLRVTLKKEYPRGPKYRILKEDEMKIAPII